MRLRKAKSKKPRQMKPDAGISGRPKVSRLAGKSRRSVHGLGESLVLIPLAALISVAAAWWARGLVSDQFLPAPRLPSPGTIVVATPASSTAVDAVQVSVTYGNDSAHRKAAIQIAINHAPESAPPNGSPAKLYVLLCGAIGENPEFVDNRGQPITWSKPKLDQGDVYSSSFGSASGCKYAALDLPPDGLRQMLLLGSTGAPIDNTSGDRILYAVPGIVSIPARFPIGDINPGPLPEGSAFTVHLAGIPGDIENVMASPQLPDSGQLQWKAPFGARDTREYRLSGDLQDRDTVGQRNLFLAGALVGRRRRRPRMVLGTERQGAYRDPQTAPCREHRRISVGTCPPSSL